MTSEFATAPCTPSRESESANIRGVRCDLLEDYVCFEYILLGDLSDLLEEPFDEETRKWMIAVLDALLDTLPQEQELKEKDGGYLSDVLETQPNWWAHVDQLRAEHDDLFMTLKVLRFDIENNDTESRAATEARLRLQDWMLSLQAHHRHETRLIQSALIFEVGGGD
ncbi:MAG: hypothetical protein CMJ78_27505 [Planctomycetaceae bacterium]|nr:hypothetical protein [Planctomycetaceae bacterium]